jgi:uncharacterized protein
MGKPVVHWEFWSRNPGKLSEFYARVFDWKIQLVPDLNYRLVDTGGQGINGGILEPQESWPGNMTFYVDVEDLDASTQKIKEAGGKMIVEKMQVPGAGTFSLFEDPEGRVNGIWLREEISQSNES